MNRHNTSDLFILSSFCVVFVLVTQLDFVILVSPNIATLSNDCVDINNNGIKKNQNDQDGQFLCYRSMRDILDNGDTLSGNDLVIRHYENLPYPPFGEDQITKEVNYYKNNTSTFWNFPSMRLEKVNHFLRKGSENFRDNYRFMVAGGGTGGVSVFVSEQLRHTNAEIIYLDFSSASMKIAQQRARIRKLENMVWIRSWIEEVRFLGLGLFKDFQCSGVLHHLKSPPYGLNVLKDQLTSDGGINIMVYGLYGRSGVYHMQELMKMINTNTHEIKKELKNVNVTLSVLPERNWFLNGNVNIGDHEHGDIGLYDLFLHKRDVAYSIETLFQWLENGGTHFVEFDSIKRKYTLKLMHQKYYDKSYDHYMRKKLSRVSLKNQLHTTEILKGTLIKHDIFASKIKDSEANLFDSSSFLYTHGNPLNLRKSLTNKDNIVPFENQTTFSVKVRLIERNLENSDITGRHYQDNGKDVIPLQFHSNDYSHFLIQQLSDSNKGVNLKDVWSDYRKTVNSTVSDDELTRLTQEFYDAVRDTDIFLVKQKHVKPFPKSCFKSYYEVGSY